MNKRFRKSKLAKAVAGFTGLMMGVLMLGGAAVMPAQAQTVADLTAQINSLLATIAQLQSQLAALQGGGGGAGVASVCPYTWTRNLNIGSQGDDVINLQQYLNQSADTRLAASGPGSPGNETDYYGPITHAAVAKFQDKYAAQILTPLGLPTGVGYPFGPSTRAHLNSLCATASGGDGGGVVVPGAVSVSAASQPSDGLFVENAARVPFTSFTITNGSASAVTVDSVTVEKAGLVNKNAFSKVLLLDGNMQLGDGRSLNANDQATIGKSVTIPAGSSKTFTVAANAGSDNSSYAGQVGGLNVVAINTSASVSGSLPISGAMHTLNASLSIGSVTLERGADDPNADRDKEIGTSDYRFSSIRVEAGSTEDIRLHSVTWKQNGSADEGDLANVVVEVDGTEYPTTVSGDEYFADLGGLLIEEGFVKDVSIKGDIVGVNANTDTVQFDIDDTWDVYVVGQDFGYGILPSAGSTSGSAGDAGSQFPTNGSPLFDGSKVTITGGSVSTISKSNHVPAQNVAINVPNQPLGGFSTNLLGEALEVDGVQFGFTITGGADASDLTNVTLLNENGAVIAGPVDGSATGGGPQGIVDFNETIEFPVGSQKYTLQGKLSTDFSDTDTIKATTTVNTTYWDDPEGVVTGDAYSLPGNTVTMNTMTVQAASLSISVGSSPAAQNIVAGTNDFEFTQYILDTTGSGEDVRFSSIPLEANGTLSATSTSINGCQLWDGSTALNRGSNVINGADIANAEADTTFTFNETLTVPKGVTKTLSLKCNVAAGASGNFSWGIDGTNAPGNMTTTGVQSNQGVTESITDSNGSTMTIGASGTLTVSVDASDPQEKWYVAGSEASVGVFEFKSSNEAFDLTRLELTLENASSSASDIAELAFFTGGSEISGTRKSSPAFSNNNELINFSGFSIPKDTDKNLDVRVKFPSVGPSLAGRSGSLVAFSTSTTAANNEAQGLESGSTVKLTGSVGTTTGARYFRSLPTVAKVSGADNSIVGGTHTLYRFSVTADSAGDIAVSRFSFNLATSGAIKVTSVDLIEEDTGLTVDSVANPTTGNATLNMDVGDGDHSNAYIEVPAGTTKTFRLDATITDDDGSTDNGNVTVKLLQDSTYPALADGNVMGVETVLDGTENFVWSPLSTTTSTATNDWTNSYRVPGLEFNDLGTNALSE